MMSWNSSRGSRKLDLHSEINPTRGWESCVGKGGKEIGSLIGPTPVSDEMIATQGVRCVDVVTKLG